LNKPRSGFMATTEGWFLAGFPNNNEFNLGLQKLVHDMVLKGEYYSPVNPESLEELFFHIDSEDWKLQFPLIFDIRKPLPTLRNHFICERVTLDWQRQIPNEYSLHVIDSNTDIDSLEFPEDIKQWAWHSLHDQIKRGFGMCLACGKKVVVWINADCASGTECEIGIITTKNYRMMGLGALTAAAAVDNCFSTGYSKVGWHCENHNYGSIAVAQKVGFVKERDYFHYICMFDEAVHYAEQGVRYFFNNEFVEAVDYFERAFALKDVSSWFYTLAARAYAVRNELEATLKCLRKARSLGWTNWDAVVQSEQIQSIFASPPLKDFFKQLG
jgi:RimJ/RimL family protein N-acetyltransferase